MLDGLGASMAMKFIGKVGDIAMNAMETNIANTIDYNNRKSLTENEMLWKRTAAEKAGFSPLAALGLSGVTGSTYQSTSNIGSELSQQGFADYQQKQIQQFEAEQAEKDRQFQAQENKLNREKANALTDAQTELVKAQTEEQNAQTRIAEANASDAEINAEINRLFPWLRTDDNSKQAQIIRQSISLGNKMVNSDLPKDERIIKINDMLALTGIPDSYVKNMRKTTNGYEFYCTDSKGVQFIVYMDKNGSSYSAKTPDGKRYYLP